VIAVVAAAMGRALSNGLRWNPDEKTGKVLQPVLLSALTWAILGAAVATWVAFWARKRSVSLGFLWFGALVGAAAGAVNAAILNVPKWLPNDMPSQTTLGWLAMIGLAVGGAILGAGIGWVWARRGSAGFSAGLLAGAIVGLIARDWQHMLTDRERVTHAVVEALIIMGVVTLAQAALDAWENRGEAAHSTLT
jgi:hypothetical protein